jgi:hypothetical protein
MLNCSMQELTSIVPRLAVPEDIDSPVIPGMASVAKLAEKRLSREMRTRKLTFYQL